MKNTVLLLSLVFTLACGKDPQVDPGPQFRLSSQGVNLSSSVALTANIKRGDPESGPAFQIQVTGIESVTKVSKVLVCPVLRLNGKTLQAPDTSMFGFKLSESEFPGLNTLPILATCSIQVTVENKIGSKFQKEIPIQFNFDTDPSVTGTRVYLSNDNFQFNGGSHFLEGYNLTNNFSYPLGFTYYLARPLTTIVPFNFSPVSTFQPVPVGVERYKIEGKYELVDVSDKSISFKVLPGETVFIRGYFSEPATLTAADPTHHFRLGAPASGTTPLTISVFRDFNFKLSDKMGENLMALPFGWIWGP